MLVACRLAGLSALEGYYAGLCVSAQFVPMQSRVASPSSSASRSTSLASEDLAGPTSARPNSVSVQPSPLLTSRAAGSPPPSRPLVEKARRSGLLF